MTCTQNHKLMTFANDVGGWWVGLTLMSNLHQIKQQKALVIISLFYFTNLNQKRFNLFAASNAVQNSCLFLT